MEYEESRAYVVGDDARTMDWRVMARTGEAHTKVFSEEKEPGLTLVVDLSASMFYGTDFAFKSWAAIQLTAHIAWLAHFDGNRLGALIASPNRIAQIKPDKTHHGLINLLNQLVVANQQSLPIVPNASRLNDLLAETQHSLALGSGVVLISDFLGIDTQSAEQLRNLSRHQRIRAFWVHDRSEVDNWLAGPYPIAVNNQNMIIDTRERSSFNWLSRQQQAHRQQITSLMTEFNIEQQAISCNLDITRQLLASLK